MTTNRFPADWTEIEAARQACFDATMDLAARHHPRIRRLMAERGLTRSDLRTPADLVRLPITTKTDYAAAPEECRLQLPADDPAIAEDARTVWDVMYTTGSTSGVPTPFVSTSWDFLDIMLLQRRMLDIRGVRPDDRIANLFPLTRHPHGAFTRALHAAAAANIPVTSHLPGNPSPRFTLGNDLDGVIDGLARTAPTILWGVPSYMRRVLARAAERGMRLPSLRLAFVTGEGLSEGGRDELTARMKALGAREPRVSISYGMTEIQGGLPECVPGAGYHNPLPEQFLFDIVDPETHQPLPDGAPGMVLLSHLNRRGTLLMRFAVGDISVRTREPCPHCGRVTERLVAQPRRADDLLKIRGMLVNPASALAAVEADPGVTDFRFAVEKETPGAALSMDVLRLDAVAGAGASGDLAARLAERVKKAIGVTPIVRLVQPSALGPAGDSAWKAKRFLDLRDAPAR
ncbi:MAG: AMP-binding protein [Alphaproteobacteria bacterium]|nr:AMP-binding protein [Alphaproteobacteria bacterium]